MSGPRRRVVLFAHRLAIDTPTGIHRYTSEMTQALSAHRVGGGPTEWAACAPREATTPGWLPAGVHAVPVPGRRRAVASAWATLRMPRLERMIGEFDLLHVLTPVFPVPTRRPLVVTVHDVLPLTHPEWYSRRERLLNGAALRQAGRAHVVTPSHAVADDVIRTLLVSPERVTVVPEGVNASPEIPAADRAAALRRYGVAERPFLLFVGSVSSRKNLAVVLSALARLVPSQPDLVLVAAGPHPPEARSTLELVAGLGLGDRVRLPGFVADRDLQALLGAAVALVHPSAYEGFGLTPLEAMSAGTPVISSNAGSLPEVVGDAGLLVGPHDAAGWLQAIEAVVGDARLRASLGERGRRRAAQFTWQRAAEQTVALYERVLSG